MQQIEPLGDNQGVSAVPAWGWRLPLCHPQTLSLSPVPTPGDGFPHVAATRSSPAVHPMGCVGSGLDLFLFYIIFKAGQPRRDGIAAFVCVKGMLLGKRGGRGAGGGLT